MDNIVSLSPQQADGMAKAETWFRQWAEWDEFGGDEDDSIANFPAPPQLFKIFGWAGTGKTTLAKQIRDMVRSVRKGQVLAATFTGKAALVMQKKGISCSTIHSLIYSPIEVIDPDTGETTVEFGLNPESPLCDASALLLDECSMVGEDLAKDLLSFGKPIIVLGDPGQLPPINGTGFFSKGTPDVMLTEIHRQAADNPIIRMSMDIRSGKGVKRGRYGQSQVIGKTDLSPDMLLSADQVLVGKNQTRAVYNQRIRALRGCNTPGVPCVDEKLICLRNERKKGLLNGGMWRPTQLPQPRGDTLEMRLASLDMEGRTAVVEVPLQFFNGEADKLTATQKRKYDEFDFGHAITVHKSQGSQWGHVLVVNENYCFREDAVKWLYTAVTRAAEKLTLAV